VELGLIIIYKLQFQVVSLLENQTLRSRSKQVRSFSFDARFGRWLFCSSLYYRRLFITRHKKWDLSLLILQFEAAEKGVKEQIEKFMNNNGTHSVDYFHRKLGKIMWDKVGMARMLRD
jgi:hypothetical protein